MRWFLTPPSEILSEKRTGLHILVLELLKEESGYGSGDAQAFPVPRMDLTLAGRCPRHLRSVTAFHRLLPDRTHGLTIVVNLEDLAFVA